MIIVSVFYHLFCLCAQKTKSEECDPHVYLNGVYIPLFFTVFVLDQFVQLLKLLIKQGLLAFSPYLLEIL